MKENIDALNEISKGVCMGMDAIDNLKSKVHDKKFSKLLNSEYNFYKTIKEKIDTQYRNYSQEKNPTETTMMNKIMLKSSINMKTMQNSTDSSIAELLLQGTNMGIIEGRKILNKKKIDDKTSKIISEFVEKQEKYVENLKKYL